MGEEWHIGIFHETSGQVRHDISGYIRAISSPLKLGANRDAFDHKRNTLENHVTEPG